MLFFIFLSGEKSTQSGAEAPLHAVAKWTAAVGGSLDLTPIQLPRLVSLLLCLRVAGW